MFERILIPLDGSPRAELILDQVEKILRREDSEILLLRVVNDHPQLRGEDTEKLIQEDREEAQQYTHELVHRLALRGVKVHARVAVGPAASTILEQADVEGATMIAMGTHGRSGPSRWFLGSVAEKIVRASRLPVLLVRSFRKTPQGRVEPAAAEELRFRKILVPTDGSPASAAVVGPAEKFAQLFDSEVVVLHAEMPFALTVGTDMGPLTVPPPAPSDEDPVTAGVAERFRHAGLKVVRRTVTGEPAGEILDQSQDEGVDLIAMATHGRSGLSRWVLGSVAERVLRHADVPLLLVRADNRERGVNVPAAGTPQETTSGR